MTDKGNNAQSEADTSASECARVLRVPGTHNTKLGGNIEVTILHTSDAEYDPALWFVGNGRP